MTEVATARPASASAIRIPKRYAHACPLATGRQRSERNVVVGPAATTTTTTASAEAEVRVGRRRRSFVASATAGTPLATAAAAQELDVVGRDLGWLRVFGGQWSLA